MKKILFLSFALISAASVLEADPLPNTCKVLREQRNALSPGTVVYKQADLDFKICHRCNSAYEKLDALQNSAMGTAEWQLANKEYQDCVNAVVARSFK